MKPPKLRLNQAAVFFAIFAVALVVRVIFVFQWNDTPYGSIPLLDAKVYDDWAQAIAQGHLLRVRAFYQSPLYPYVLGALYALFGHSLLLAGLFNAVLGALTAAILGIVALTYFGIEAAVMTGLLAALYRLTILYTAPVMKEPLALFLLALFLLFILRALTQNRLRDYIWSGMCLGLCTLVRGNALLLAPVVLAFGFFKWRGKAAKNGALFVGMMLLCIAPATIHNYIVSGDFVLINYDDGFNLYIGHSPSANGTNEYPPEISTDPVQEELATIWEARKVAGHAVNPSEVSHFWRMKAVDFILHNPGREIDLIKNKFLAFWSTAESFDSYDIGFIRKNFDTLISSPLMTFFPVSALAAFGAIAAWREKREVVAILSVFTLVYMLSALLFYITDRYRLPVTVFLLPLAGAAIPYGQKLAQRREWKWISAGAALAVVFLFLGLRTPSGGAVVDLTAFDWGTLSTIYFDLGEDQETLDALDKAMAISAEDAGSQAFVRGAMVEQSRGREEEAEKLLKDAIRLYPDDGVLEYNYGRMKAMRGDLKGALVELRKAVALAPTYLLNYYALAKIYEKLGDETHATEAARQGLMVDPSDPLLLEIFERLQNKTN